jgi:hypothetical protein
VQYLLAQHKADACTPEEAAELEHLMQLIKARAHLYAEQPV